MISELDFMHFVDCRLCGAPIIETYQRLDEAIRCREALLCTGCGHWSIYVDQPAKATS